MIRPQLPPRPAGRLASLLTALLLVVAPAFGQHDLSMFRLASDTYLERGQIVTFTFVVTNDRGTDVDDVAVDISIPAGLAYRTHSLSADFNPATGRWNIGRIRFFQPQRILSIDFTVVGEGVQIATAEIATMAGTDEDSTPGNGVLDEDDMVSACVTVPIRAECGQSVHLTAPAGYGGYQWYRDGTLIPGATASTLDVGQTGAYNFAIAGASSACVLGSCCPAVVTFDSISVALSQNLLCTGGLDTARVSMPPVDTVAFAQTYTWASLDDPTLRFLSCISCAEPSIVINADFPGDTLRYQVSVVTRDRDGNIACSAAATLAIAVAQAPKLAFDAPTYVCADQCHDIGVAPDLPIASVVWDGPNLRTLDGLRMQYCPRTTNTYQTERFVVTAVGTDGCVRVDSIEIRTMPGFAVVAGGDPRQCQGLPVELWAQTQPAQPSDSVSYSWTEEPGNPNAGANLPATDRASVTTDSLRPGSYGFSVSVSRLAPDGTWACTYERTHRLEVEADCEQPRLGGFAWKDGNADGLRQNWEAPLEGVRADLFREDGTPLGLTAVSDQTGFYEFADLAIGNYFVRFAPLPGFAFAPQNVGADEFVDSDADATGQTDLFSATYDQAVHLVGVGYVGDCTLAITDVATSPSDCGNSAGTLTFAVAGGSGAYRYAWQPALATGTTASGLPSGEYAITVTDTVTGCVLTEVLTVPGETNFRLTASSAPAACPLGRGGSVTLFVDGGIAPFAITFVGPDTGSRNAARMPYTIQDLLAGDYAVVVTDAAGCRQRVSIEVTENPLLLTLDTVDVVRPTCGGGTDGAFAVLVDGFNGRYRLTVNGQTIVANATQTRVDVSGRAAGPITVEVVDVNGCAQRLDFQLRDGGPAIDLADLVLADPRCRGEASGSIASRSSSAYEVRDARGRLRGTLPLVGLEAGRYNVVDRSVPGCVVSVEVALEDPADWHVSATVTASDCGGTGGGIAVVNRGDRGPYSLRWDRSLSPLYVQRDLAPGAYRLWLTDTAGCVLDTTFIVPDGCVPVACERYFTADTVVVESDGRPFAWCLPNFTQPTDRTFTLGGVPVATAVCNRSELVTYNLEGLPGDGADGPFVVEFWFSGEEIVRGTIVADGRVLAQALDDADAWGRWQYDTVGNYVAGGVPGRAYGEIEITHVRSGNRYYLTPEPIENQISAAVTLGGYGAYDLRTFQGGNGCTDSLHVIVRAPDPCRDIYRPGVATAATPYCDQATTVCIGVPFGRLDDHALVLDGLPYTGSREACDLDDVVYYDLAGVDLSAGFGLQTWIVDGRGYNARVAGVAELAARMTGFDQLTWRFDAHTGLLRGGDPRRTYRDLVLRVDGRDVRLAPQRGIYDGTRIAVLPGTYRATLSRPDGCAAAFTVAVRCSSGGVPQKDTLRHLVALGYTDTLCLSTAELSAGLDEVGNYCPAGSGVFAEATLLDSTCYALSGLAIGVDTVCVRVCDINGVCDTTVVLVDVRDPASLLLPDAVDDTDSLRFNSVATVDVLANDEPRGALVAFEITRYPRHGRARVTDGGIEYTAKPEHCGLDSLQYEICNSSGCDRATVRIKVTCGDLIIYSGFSPDYDDVNETFTVLGVEQYPGNRMQVYNRWGNLVFEMEDYDNSWRGTAFDGDELPEGTYYYVFEDGRGRQHTGYVYLRR